MKFTPVIVATLVLLLAAACSGHGQPGAFGRPVESAALMRPDLPATIPAAEGLPGPAQLDSLRAGSELVETLIGGSFTLSRSAGAAEQGDALLLDASASGPGLGAVPEWAVYGFDPAAAGGSLDSLQVLLDSAAGGAWIGLGDFSAERWEWHGPYSSFKSLLVDDAKYLSPGGTLFISVVSPAGVSSTVSALSVRTINPNNLAPTADLQADVTSGNAPLTVSFDASASSDNDGEIIEYAWDFDGNGTYEEFSDGPQVEHVYGGAGIFSAKVRVTDDSLARASATLAVNVNVAGNQLPVADFEASATSGTAPLSVTFDASASADADGSISEYAWDLDGNGSFEESTAGPLIQHVYSIGGGFTVWLRVTDDKGAQSLLSVSIQVNTAPQAQMFLQPADVQLGAIYFLDGGQSDDLDGTIQSYEWDIGGDGFFETNSGTNSRIQQTAILAGPQLISLRVTDNDGGTATATQSLYVRGWLPGFATEPGNGGFYDSMAVVNGRPAAAYHDSDVSQLYFTRATDGEGSSWDAPVLVDGTGSTGAYVSMIVVAGRPAICYYQISNGDLYYVRAQDPDGAAWGAPIVVDSTNDTGEFCSMQVVNGRPAISYYYTTGQKLQYVRAGDAAGSSWGSPVVVDPGANNGHHGCLRVVSSYPAISYYDVAAADLNFVRANDADGTSWGAPVQVDSSGGAFTSMTTVQGQPAISYFSETLQQMRYVRATSPIGSSWGTPVTLTTGAGDGWYTSIQVIDGAPAISYKQGNSVRFVQAVDSLGTIWKQAVTVYASSNGGYNTNLLLLSSGRPVISFCDIEQMHIGFARLY